MERDVKKGDFVPPEVAQTETGVNHHESVDPFVVLPNGRIESIYSRFETEHTVIPNQKRRTGKNKRKFRR